MPLCACGLRARAFCPQQPSFIIDLQLIMQREFYPFLRSSRRSASRAARAEIIVCMTGSKNRRPFRPAVFTWYDLPNQLFLAILPHCGPQARTKLRRRWVCRDIHTDRAEKSQRRRREFSLRSPRLPKAAAFASSVSRLARRTTEFHRRRSAQPCHPSRHNGRCAQPPFSVTDHLRRDQVRRSASLKLSRSTKRRAPEGLLRVLALSAWRTRSIRRTRFGRPVSWSKKASSRIFPSACFVGNIIIGADVIGNFARLVFYRRYGKPARTMFSALGSETDFALPAAGN